MWFALAVLATVHAIVLCANFFAPYGAAEQNRDFPYAPPMRIHFFDSQGKFHLRPFVYPLAFSIASTGSPQYTEERSRILPIRFFVAHEETEEGRFLGARRHLFGVDPPARIFLLGTDGYGRDEFSRLLFGGQISLFAGLLAATLSLALGLVLGSFAGFYGTFLDDLIMRGSEVFMALPWIYLLFAVRAFLPLQLGPRPTFFLLIAVIGLTGWARPSRLVRGVVLSAKQRDYVYAARGFGASDLYILRRHVLPETFSVLLTQAALLIPQYILAEVTFSFLGLGVGEPIASWGNMLADLQKLYVLESYWWMFAPGLALSAVFLLYYVLADALHIKLRGIEL
jgi:peptide/nickel transport system permease protein